MSDISILLLGSGAVAGPCVDYLLRNPRNKLTIGELPMFGEINGFHSLMLTAMI